MSKNIRRVVSTGFWEDQKVMTLFTPEDKYFMLYLLTNPHTTQLGVYQLVPKIAGFEMGYSVEAVESLLERFETKYGIIKYNTETMEVAIKNFLKHSIVKGGKPVMDCLINEKNNVKDKSLLLFIAESLEDYECILPTVKDFIKTIKEENTINNLLSINNTHINDNDNDNENERNVHVTSTLRGHDLEIAKNSGFFDDDELSNAYIDFFKMRKTIKKPLTDRAVSMLKNQLEKLAPGDSSKQAAILNQSTFHCWQGVFELKKDTDNGRHDEQKVSGEWQ